MAGRKGQSPARLARTRPRPRHHRPPPWPRGKAPRRHRRLRCRGPIAPPPSSRWPRTSSRSSWRSSSGPASPARLLQPHGARRVTKMSNRVANSILSGVLKVLGFITSTVVNSKPAQKFFKLMPGDVILASLDGFRKLLPLVVHVTFA